MGHVVKLTTNLLLIHGAWAGRWVWQTITPEFEKLGYCVHAVDLPGNGVDNTPANEVNIDTYLWFLSEQIANIEGPLVVVSHSGAGVLATALAEAMPERIQAVVYIAGMMLPSGMGFSDLTAGLEAEYPEVTGINPYLLWNDGHDVSRVPLIAAREIFFQDLDNETAISAAQQLCAQPLGGLALMTCWTEENFGRVPRLYIEATQDKSVTLVAQREMQARVPGAQVVSLDTGHAPQVGKPVEVATAIDQFLKTSGDDEVKEIPPLSVNQ